MNQEGEKTSRKSIKSADWHFGSLQRHDHWISQHGHNHLRIRRVIKSVRLVASDEVARCNKREQLAKETHYSASRMNKRMVSADEMNSSFGLDLKSAKAVYLRWNTERGKRM